MCWPYRRSNTNPLGYNMNMQDTSIIEKLVPSIINVAIVLLISSPILILKSSVLEKKLIIIGLFFLYGLIFIFFNNGRDLGMILFKTYWKEHYPLIQMLIYNFLYTLSFSTLFFWKFFPFDIFLFNMLVLQLPIILLTGTTLHGFLSGGMTTVIR